VAGGEPTDDDLLAEAQKIVRKVDATDTNPQGPEISWFRDLIMLSGPSSRTGSTELANIVGLGPLSNVTWAEKLEKIHAQSYLDPTIIQCKKERKLMEFVRSKVALGLTPTDSELQVQACAILDEVESTANYKCQGAIQWFNFLASSSKGWLTEFRRRSGLPRSSELTYEHIRSTDDKTIDYSIHNSYRLQGELKDWVQLQRAVGKTPSDADIQRQARLIIYACDDPWNQTVVDDIHHLNTFKRQNGLPPVEGLPMLPEVGESPLYLSSSSQSDAAASPRKLHWDLESRGIGLPSPLNKHDRPSHSPLDQPLRTMVQNQPSTNTNPTHPLRYFLNDANCYGRLAKELTRFVMSCMSPNNPRQHVCSPVLSSFLLSCQFPVARSCAHPAAYRFRPMESSKTKLAG
jgi:hypothetical protein